MSDNKDIAVLAKKVYELFLRDNPLAKLYVNVDSAVNKA